MRREPYAVQASVSRIGMLQAAIVGIVVSGRLELFFDTLATSRKAINLRRNPSAAFVIGQPTPALNRLCNTRGSQMNQPVRNCRSFWISTMPRSPRAAHVGSCGVAG